MDFLDGITLGVVLSIGIVMLARGTILREKKYYYYVSFYIIAQDNSTGFGSANIVRSNEIDSLADIQALTESMRREQNARGITILNITECEK